MKRIFVGLILIHSLIAAPTSVEKLLRKPLLGPVRIDLNNGSQIEGYLARVTTQFIAVKRAQSCELVPIAEIRELRRPRVQDDEGPLWGWILAFTVTSPVWVPAAAIHEIKRPFVKDSNQTLPFTGRWKSPDGKSLAITEWAAERWRFSTEDATYQIDHTRLRLDSGETYDAEYECDMLRLGGETLIQKTQPQPAEAPNVGAWYPNPAAQRPEWTFRADRTYNRTRQLSYISGTVDKAGHNVLITWPDGTQSIATRHGKTITLTTNGVVEEFTRVAAGSLP